MKRNGRKYQTPRPPPNKRDRDYVNSPLVETVFEIRFPGEPAIECHRDEFFAGIRDKFPIVGVPNTKPGEPIALQPYHFRSQDGLETVMVALNRFAYATRRYPGFRAFEPKALKLTQQFCKQFKIDRLTRTGLRYINMIPFLREGGMIPWNRYFTVDLTLPATSADDFMNVGLTLESRCAKGVIRTQIACGKSADASKELFLLDFDFAKTDRLTTRGLRTYIKESHDHTKKVFEGIVSDSYKSVMRGEVIQ